jgi:hypothetical protein
VRGDRMTTGSNFLGFYTRRCPSICTRREGITLRCWRPLRGFVFMLVADENGGRCGFSRLGQFVTLCVVLRFFSKLLKQGPTRNMAVTLKHTISLSVELNIFGDFATRRRITLLFAAPCLSVRLTVWQPDNNWFFTKFVSLNNIGPICAFIC